MVSLAVNGLSYNATITANAATHLYPYRVQAAPNAAEDEVGEEVES